MDAAGVLDRLCRRAAIEAPAVVVVAHPDDETIGVGASLALLRDVTLVHVTDGAPQSMHDAHAAGFETAQDYAAARRCELRCAMEAAAASPLYVSLGVPDQEAVQHAADLVAALVEILAGSALVITHAYEGGHPDHDACALAVQHSAARLPQLPVLLEFPAYHAGADGDWAMQRFLPNGPAGVDLKLAPPEVARKRAALDCFATQRETLVRFDPARELLREAPAYDFELPPHAGPLLYEGFGWQLTGERWRELARSAEA